MSDEIVKVDRLFKKYGKRAEWAVEDVSFDVKAGEIVGLLGHNGAGKSTTLRCLEGMLPFDRGNISICGRDIVRDPIGAKSQMGFVTDDHAVFVKMTGVQYLDFICDVYKVPVGVRKERYRELESVFALGDSVRDLIASYSHGMRQKICMMGSLVHRPKLWVLDEPMTGLDPRTMRAVRELMTDYAKSGNGILFSSHALDTVAKLCDRVVLIRKGKQVSDLNVREIAASDPDFDFEEYYLSNEI